MLANVRITFYLCSVNMFDIAKLIFGGVVIGSLIEAKENWIYLLLVGSIMFFVLLWIGNKYFNKGNRSIK